MCREAALTNHCWDLLHRRLERAMLEGIRYLSPGMWLEANHERAALALGGQWTHKVCL